VNLIGNRQAGNDDLMALATALSHARPRHGTQPQDIEPTPLLAQAQRLRRPDRVGGRRAACTRPPRAHAGWGSATAFVRDRPMTSSESIPPVPDALAAKLRELAGRDTVAGAAVTVVRDGQAIGFWSVGYASLPFRVPVTERTLFHIGSVGKHITALAVMQLVDAGSVALDAPVGGYVQGLPESWAVIPVRRLLTHTSGLPDYGRVIRDWDRPQGRELILNAIGTMPPSFEAISGQPYADYLRDRLLGPAALPAARVDSAGDVIADRAEPYEHANGRFVHAVQLERSVSAAADGGALFSGRDIAPWSAALTGARLVSPALMAQATTGALLTTGR